MIITKNKLCTSALAGDREEYILNGDRVISPYPKNFTFGGVIFQYTGTDSTREKVSAPYSKPLQRDLMVEVNNLSKSCDSKKIKFLLQDFIDSQSY